MSQARGTRRGARTRRGSRRRYTLLDHLMLAGIVGMGVCLILHSVLIVPVPAAAVAGVLSAGYYLGSAVRPPRIGWRRGR